MQYYKLVGFKPWWVNSFSSAIPLLHIEQLMRIWNSSWHPIKNISWKDIGTVIGNSINSELPEYIKVVDGETSYYYYINDNDKVRTLKNNNVYYEGNYELDMYMTMFHKKLHILLKNDAKLQFKRKFCNRWYYDAETGTYSIDFLKQKYLADHFTESNQLLREKAFSVTAEQLYRQNYDNYDNFPTSYTISKYNALSTQWTLTDFKTKMEKTNNLNRYRYLVAKSSAKVNSTDNEKLISTNTTQTIIVVPFLDSIDVSHGLNDLSITKNQNGALSALGDNQIGIFDCDLPYSIIFGMVDNDKVKMLYAENVLNDSTIVQIPFFEIDINYTRKIQLLNYILYTKGFLGKLQYMINNSDKVLPETEPLFLAPNRYQEVYNNGCTEQPIINNSAYFTYSWTRENASNAFTNLSLECYLMFNDNLYMTYDFGDHTNVALSSWDNTQTNITTAGLSCGFLSSSAANYYANNVNTGLTQASVRQSEEKQAWIDYGFDTARNVVDVATAFGGISSVFNPGKGVAQAVKAGLNIAQGAIDTSMTQQRANQQFRSSINNIYAGSSTIASNPLIKALIPNKKDELFLTYCLSLHPYDVKMTMIDYLNNGYIYNTIDSLKSFINRIYMNVLDVDAYTNYDINLKYILDNDDSYFNKRKYNDLFFNWLNMKHQVYNTPHLINVTDYTRDDYYHNIEIETLPFSKINVENLSWFFRESYSGSAEEIKAAFIADNSFMPQQIMDDVDITTTTTRITITALATSKFLYGQLIHDIVPPVKKEFTLSCYDGLQLPYPSSLFYVEGVRMSFYNGKEWEIIGPNSPGVLVYTITSQPDKLEMSWTRYAGSTYGWVVSQVGTTVTGDGTFTVTASYTIDGVKYEASDTGTYIKRK